VSGFPPTSGFVVDADGVAEDWTAWSRAEREAAADTEAAPTAFGPQIAAQAWSTEDGEPDTEPDVEQYHHEWSVAWRYAAALFSVGIAVSVAVGAILYVTGLGHDKATPPPPTASSTVAAPPLPPPPRVDTAEDFDAALRCSDGQLAWSTGYAWYFGGIPHGVTVDAYGGQQPQMVLDNWRSGGVVVDCSRVDGQLQTIGVTIVTIPSGHPQARRVRYFVTQTQQQSEALQAYLQNYRYWYRGDEAGGPEMGREATAMVANTGFCVQPDTRCERDY
jgi:hypothetical protein